MKTFKKANGTVINKPKNAREKRLAKVYDESQYPKSLADLNKFLKTFTQWQAVRSPAGYYYFIHPTKAPSSGVYVFNCRAIKYSAWRNEVKAADENTIY